MRWYSGEEVDELYNWPVSHYQVWATDASCQLPVSDDDPSIERAVRPVFVDGLDHPNEQVCYYVRAVNERGTAGFWSEEVRAAGGTRVRPELSVSGGDAVVEGGVAHFTVNAFPAPVAGETLAFSYTVSQQGDFVAAGELGRKDVTMTDSGEFRVEVPTVPDDVDEAHGSVTVTLNGGSGYDLSSARSATVAVMDDETVSVNFLPNQTDEVGENIGRHNVAVAINPAPAADLTIGYTVDPSSAADAGDDYRIAGLSDGSGTVTARRGATSVNIPVQVVNDGAGETDETVILTLSASDDYGLAAPTTYTLTIRDDDGTGVGFAEESSSVAEDVFGGTHEITVNLVPPAPAGGLTIDYNVSGGGSGRAVSPDDYTIAGVTGNTGTVTANQGDRSVTISVTIADDGENEGDETVELTLRSSADYKTAGRIGKHTLTILDDDRPRASFALGASREDEHDAGPHDVRVNLDPAPPADLTLRYRVGGTATRGRDYAMDSYSAMTVPAGATNAQIPVTITDDGDSEPAEWVELELLAGPDYTLGTLWRHRLTITDDDVPGIAFNVAEASVGESARTYRVVIDMEPGPHEDITINYSVVGARTTASSPEDYTIAGRTGNTGTVTARRGSGRVVVPIAIIDDGAAEAAEKVVLTLEAGDGYTLAGAHEFTLTIEDNDAAVASFRETEDEVSEGTAWATATVELNQALDNDVTINYEIPGPGHPRR